LLSSVARAEGIHDLGFRIAGHLGIESLGVYGRLVARSVTMHEAIQMSRALISSYNSGLQIWMERHGSQVRYCQKYPANLPRDGITEIVHLGLANALAQAGARRGREYQPTRIELASDPIELGPYVPGFGDLAVSFNQPQTSVWFDQTWLSKPLPAFEPGHFRPATHEERASFVTLRPSTDPVGQLEQVIESALGHPRMSLQLIAAIIGTSARTLQRRLAEHGLSFSGLLGRVRFAVAQRFLRDREMLLAEIARRLGYSDLPNFMRAFKRWTGVGPNEFRRLHCGAGCQRGRVRTSV
jgi:AraC-like DNA-binding protein